MPKEVRLNDKMWFGKYRGRTIKDILKIDKCFLDDLILKNKITFHSNVMNYLTSNVRKNRFTAPGSWGEPAEPPQYGVRPTDWEERWWENPPDIPMGGEGTHQEAAVDS